MLPIKIGSLCSGRFTSYGEELKFFKICPFRRCSKGFPAIAGYYSVLNLLSGRCSGRMAAITGDFPIVAGIVLVIVGLVPVVVGVLPAVAGCCSNLHVATSAGYYSVSTLAS